MKGMWKMVDRVANYEMERRFYWELGYRVKVAREIRKIAQGELAESCGLSRTSVNNLEAGRQRIPLVTLARIAARLRVPMARLIPPLQQNGSRRGVPREAPE